MFIYKKKSHSHHSHHSHSQISITSNRYCWGGVAKFFCSALFLSSLLSCNKSTPDPQTLHFTTHDGIKMSLDVELEMYRVDNKANLFYMNSKYYTKNKTGQWSFSSKPEGPWKMFPDQAMVPGGLVFLKE